MKSAAPRTIEQKIESLFEELLEQQQAKVLKTARDRLPHLTGDDVLNPNDFPELMADPVFNYEEGLAAGLMAAQFAIRARVLRQLEQEQRS
jgi:hypothetical protein